MDYCGPLYINEKKHKNRGNVKVYACIFVCFAIKTIHIELLSDLTSEAFIGRLRRFFSRRGRAANLYSDNATYFVGTKNEVESKNFSQRSTITRCQTFHVTAELNDIFHHLTYHISAVSGKPQ